MAQALGALAHRPPRAAGVRVDRDRDLRRNPARRRYAGRLRRHRGAFQVRLHRGRARVGISLLDLPGDAARLRQAPAAGRRLGLARAHLRGGQGAARRHVQAQRSGRRPHVPELRRLPRQYGARHAAVEAARRARYAGEHLQHLRLPEVRLRLRARPAVRDRVLRAGDRPADAREGRAARAPRSLRHLSDRRRTDARAAADAARAPRAVAERHAVGPRPDRHVQPEQDPVQLSPGQAARARAERRRRLPVHLAAEAAPGHAAPLGRQQRDVRGAEQERRVRDRHDAADDRSRRDCTARAVAPDRGAAEVSLPDRFREGAARRHALRAVLRRLPWRERTQLHRAGGHAVARVRGHEGGRERSLRPAGRQDHPHRARRHRSASPRFVLLRPGGAHGHRLRWLSAPLLPLPQDLRLRQHAARRHMVACAVSAQRLGAHAARSTRAGAEASEDVLPRQRRLRPEEGRLRLRAARAGRANVRPLRDRKSRATAMPATRARPTAPSFRPRTRTRWSSI